MKSYSKQLYRCGTSNLLLLLVRKSAKRKEWKSYLFSDDTGETVYQSGVSDSFSVQRAAQMVALLSGHSAVLVPVG